MITVSALLFIVLLVKAISWLKIIPLTIVRERSADSNFVIRF